MKSRKPRQGQRSGHVIPQETIALELIASVSRSSGLEKDGDALKDFKVQEKYRFFIQSKLDNYWRRFPPITARSSASASNPLYSERKNAQENILIMFRKLREGISSSQRYDLFSVEAYETSSYLAVLFESGRQASSVFIHLVPDLYLKVREPQSRCQTTVLISSLHNLISAYPSQSLFRDRLSVVPHDLFPTNSPARVWLSSVSSSLRSRNFVKFDEVTRTSGFAHLLDNSYKLGGQQLCDDAIRVLVDKLRKVSRTVAWTVIRHAYRELSFGVELEGTRDWLERSLALQPVAPGAETGVSVEQWLQKKEAEGHIRRKEGAANKYIICKVR